MRGCWIIITRKINKIRRKRKNNIKKRTLLSFIILEGYRWFYANPVHDFQVIFITTSSRCFFFCHKWLTLPQSLIRHGAHNKTEKIECISSARQNTTKTTEQANKNTHTRSTRQINRKILPEHLLTSTNPCRHGSNFPGSRLSLSLSSNVWIVKLRTWSWKGRKLDFIRILRLKIQDD